MDMRKVSSEIGLFEAAVNLAKVRNSDDVKRKVGYSMPLPDDDINERVDLIAKWLVSFGKTVFLFLTPELALIDAVAKNTTPKETEITVVLPSNMDMEAKERIRNNLPRTIPVKSLEEPYFHANMYPSNGMIVVSGYCGGGHLMVMNDTYRMVEHYNSVFYGGKKAFVPYVEIDEARRYEGWMEMKPQRITETWRKA